jgi:formate dehydrogenase assembly factor FdhD
MNVKRDGDPVRRILIDAMRGGQFRSHEDIVIVEEPLEIRLAKLGEPGPGRAVSITMRAPGNDIELAADVPLDLSRLERNFYTSSSCGICGKASLQAVDEMLPIRAVGTASTVSPGLLGSLVLRTRGAQNVFRETGGLHASSLFDAHAAGVPVVAAVGAPSSLAIDLAERTGILLIGFLRDESFNVYTHRERLQ